MFFSSPLNIIFFDPRTEKGNIHISTENGPAPPKIAVSPHGLSYTDSCLSTSPGREQSYTRTFKFNGTVIDRCDPLYPLLACAKFCRKCRTSETSYWRTDGNGNHHCNRCILRRQHIVPSGQPRTYRPIELKKFACQTCAKRVARDPGQRRDQYMGLIMCDLCTTSWKLRLSKRSRGGGAPAPAIRKLSRQHSPTDDTPADLPLLPPLKLGTPPPFLHENLAQLWGNLTI